MSRPAKPSRIKGIDPHDGYWVYGEYLDNEIEILLQNIEMKDVDFINSPEKLIRAISTFVANENQDSVNHKIILYKPGAHIQAIFTNINEDGEVDIFIFDSLGVDKMSIMKKECTPDIYKELQDSKIQFNIFFTQNQRQVPLVGCIGFALSDIEKMKKHPNLVTQIKDDGLICKDYQNFSTFLLPPEFMLSMHLLSKIPEYTLYLQNNTSVHKARIDQFSKSMEEYTTPIYEEVTASNLKRVKTSHNLASLFADEGNDNQEEDVKQSTKEVKKEVGLPKKEMITRRKHVHNDRNAQYLVILADLLKSVIYDKLKPSNSFQAVGADSKGQGQNNDLYKN